MKQHILRLLIVLILAVGIGFVIYYLVKDNSTFSVSDYAKEEFNKNSETYNLIETLRDDVNATFINNKTIYDSYLESFNYFTGFLTDNVTKNERDSIKVSFKDFNEKFASLKVSLKSLQNYLNEQNANQQELDGRKNKVCDNFNELNLSFYSLNLKLENIIKTKVFNNSYLDGTFALTSSKNLLLKTYLQLNANSKYSFVKSVADKVTALKNNGYRINEDAVKFSIKYNSVYSNVASLYYNYLDSDVTTADLNELLERLNKEAYYEEA